MGDLLAVIQSAADPFGRTQLCHRVAASHSPIERSTHAVAIYMHR